MSLIINWELLKDGVEAERLKQMVNERFREVERPSFLGNVVVAELDFGDIPPEISIEDICDPMPEFYVHDDTDYASENDSRAQTVVAQPPPHLQPAYGHPSPYAPAGMGGMGGVGMGVGVGVGYAGARMRGAISNERLSAGGSGSGAIAGVAGVAGPRSRDSPSSVLDLADEAVLQVPRQDTDAQLELAVRYHGNMRLSISTELIVNQPTPAFMVLPLALTVTGFWFEGTAVIAYLGSMINFCFKEPPNGEDVLRDMTIESEIGDKNKQVLKNVGKIEKFIVQQLKKFFNDFVVFPNYHSLYLVQDGEDDDGVSSGIE
ncbi:Mitochondrial distribution and morphology protein 12 [Polyrhizophydium stewartii]|uniref:Mitochondrial distribution and morphology protein 12 n=1 Tax=Polyrhizophydium stewartii TaxID=2732419 RepID=A0ABR4N1P4_9FUNG|nr:Mitochondrial distribution and morphology protein 12 [Polyrhizophydium stewartii]